MAAEAPTNRRVARGAGHLTRRGFCAAVLLVALFASGCAEPSRTSTPEPSGETAPTAIATIDAGQLIGGRLTCGNGTTFPAAAVQGPGGAELGGDAVAAALRSVLAEYTQYPRSGWHRVSVSPTQAEFVARGVGDPPWVVVALMQSASGWTMDEVGECHLQFVLGKGIAVASWWVDPAAAVPGPDATALMALVDQECGGPLEGRIPSPVVIYAPDAIVVMFGVTTPIGGGGEDSICNQSPPISYRVVLTEPLGRRALLDGSVIPPRDATKPRS
jgi:hypothetical protein